MSKSGGIRLYVDDELRQGQDVAVSREQSHYLFGVMRKSVGDTVVLFNGRGGAWAARVVKAGKAGILEVEDLQTPQWASPDIRLMFAPVKKARFDFIVEKAVELGVSRLSPVLTRYTNSERVRTDRMEKIAIEAAEQSERLDLPTIDPPQKLEAAVADLPEETTLVVLSEREDVGGGLVDLKSISLPVALVVGPEGGFAPEELEMLSTRDGCVLLSLGPRILRADTAVVAGLSLIQSHLGDWS